MHNIWKQRWHEIIFGTETKAGRRFDVVLLWVILSSVLIVIIESLPEVNQRYDKELFILESFFTALFTLEYLARIIVSPKPKKYIFSIWGVIDFLSIVPFYLSIFIPSYEYFLVLRLFRLLRVFRILKLLRFLKESQYILLALRASAYKIGVFISAVLTVVILSGTLMYVIEGPKNGFTSIPQSIYWTIVTITTVGYGDITPQTYAGKLIASVIMLCGYAIIAVPTGIVTVEMSRKRGDFDLEHLECKNCSHQIPLPSNFCNNCGKAISNIIETS